MSLNQDQAERRYNAQTDRLFLVYYPIIPGYNGNKWGVTENSLHTNIQTAINKPVVVYRKNPTNRYHTHQAGNFVHPTIEEAAAEIGHPLKAEEYYNWQERFAIGRVRNVDKRDKGYAFTLEITDPDAKTILKSDRYSTGIPGWTSPQIISNSRLYPEEEASGIFNHWTISHIALVDIPAYGVEQSALRGKCFGAEKECLIQTKSASQENLGFCVKQAAIDLIESYSSHQTQVSNPSHNTMSQSENTAAKSSETVTYVATPTDNTNPIAITGETEKPQGQEPPEKNPPPVEPEPTTKETLQGAKTLEEANAQIRQMAELLQETNKQLKAQQKELDRISLSERKARLAFIIPRDLFKSDDSHQKEVEKTLNEKVSESWLIDYWKTKRELAMVQSSKTKQEEPLVAKSASLQQQQQQQHEVPDFSSSQNQSQRSINQKLMDLQRMVLEGGGSG